MILKVCLFRGGGGKAQTLRRMSGCFWGFQVQDTNRSPRTLTTDGKQTENPH